MQKASKYAKAPSLHQYQVLVQLQAVCTDQLLRQQKTGTVTSKSPKENVGPTERTENSKGDVQNEQGHE